MNYARKTDTIETWTKIKYQIMSNAKLKNVFDCVSINRKTIQTFIFPADTYINWRSPNTARRIQQLENICRKGTITFLKRDGRVLRLPVNYRKQLYSKATNTTGWEQGIFPYFVHFRRAQNMQRTFRLMNNQLECLWVSTSSKNRVGGCGRF